MHEREAAGEEHRSWSSSFQEVLEEQREPCPQAAHAALLEEQQMFHSSITQLRL